jgi:hypothetical protein
MALASTAFVPRAFLSMAPYQVEKRDGIVMASGVESSSNPGKEPLE